MPCYDPRDNDPSEIRQEARKQLAIEFRHNSPVAEMLCHILTHIHPAEIATMPEEIQVWWKEHQARDAAKERANGN